MRIINEPDLAAIEAEALSAIENTQLTDGELENYIALMLGVENPREVVAASQASIVVEDDTDFDEAAKFNMDQWLEESGLNTPEAKAKADLPMALRERQL